MGADVKDQDINLDLGLLKDTSAGWMKLGSDITFSFFPAFQKHITTILVTYSKF